MAKRKPIVLDDKKLIKLGKERGFVTQEDLSSFNLPGVVAVYMPHSYAFSGNLFFVDKSKIKPFKGESSNLMKFIVSGGVINTDDKNEDDSI